MSTEKHHYQWDSTENALAFINFTVVKNKNSFDAEKVFLNTPCFVTEKYDGTNLAKDDLGVIYSRRFALGDDEQEFIKTSLKNVREADINLFKSTLIEIGGLDPNNIVKCVVYGEFICNAWYDYEKRGLIGKWKVFAAKLEVKEDGPAILAKFRELGFAVPKRSGNPSHVKLYGNEKFFELAKQADLDVPDFRGTDVSFAKMVEMNKDDMKTGRIEGLVITLNTEDSGYKFIKWKGSQEFQPHAHTNFQKANDKIQNSETHEDVRKAFDIILEIITDISQNELAQKMMNKKNPGGDKRKPKDQKEKKEKAGVFLTPVDKDIILLGIPHCQKKFDSVEEFKKRGDSALEEYVGTLTKEVRDHLAKENCDFAGVGDDDNVMGFIRSKVRSTIENQLADLNTVRAS